MLTPQQDELIRKIKELPPYIQKGENKIDVDVDVGYKNKFVFSLFKKVEIKTSLRNYLLKRAQSKSGFAKAQAIYQLLVDPNATFQSLQNAIKVQRKVVHSEETKGEKILKGATSLYQPIRQEERKVDEKKEDEPQVALHASENLVFDTDTNPNETISAINVFPGIPPSEYRVAVFYDVAYGPPLSLKTIGDIQPIDPPEIKEPNAQEQKEVNLPLPLQTKIGEYTPLVTLSPTDTLFNVKPNFEYQLGYSETAKQYYIMPLSNPNDGSPFRVGYQLHPGKKQVLQEDVDYKSFFETLRTSFEFKDENRSLTLTIEEGEKLNEFYRLSDKQKLFVLQEFFKSFEAKDLSEKFAAASVLAINAMLKEKAGVCSHRAILFLTLTRFFNLNVNLIANDVHAFIEAEGATIDLGGKQTHVKLTDIPVPPKKVEKEEDAKEEKSASAMSDERAPQSMRINAVQGFNAPLLKEIEITPDGKIRFHCKNYSLREDNSNTLYAQRSKQYSSILNSYSSRHSLGNGENYYELKDSDAAKEALDKLHQYELTLKKNTHYHNSLLEAKAELEKCIAKKVSCVRGYDAWIIDKVVFTQYEYRIYYKKPKQFSDYEIADWKTPERIPEYEKIMSQLSGQKKQGDNSESFYYQFSDPQQVLKALDRIHQYELDFSRKTKTHYEKGNYLEAARKEFHEQSGLPVPAVAAPRR